MSPRWLGAVPLALLIGMGIGRYTRTVQTRDVVRVETQWRDREVVKVVHDVQTVHDVATQTRTVTVTRWAKAPDGSPVVTQESHQERDQQAETKRQAQTTRAQERTAEGQQAVVELHTVEARPAWSLSLLAGGQLGGHRLFEAVVPGVVVGVALERRILGPVSAGLWATSGMAGGLSLRVDF